MERTVLNVYYIIHIIRFHVYYSAHFGVTCTRIMVYSSIVSCPDGKLRKIRLVTFGQKLGSREIFTHSRRNLSATNEIAVDVIIVTRY